MDRVALCVPAYGKIDPLTVQSLIALVTRGLVVSHNLDSFISKPFIYVDQARNDTVRQLLTEARASHSLWLDADMVWPHDTLDRLLAHRRPVVGGCYFLRTPPHDCVAFHFTDKGADRLDLRGTPPGLVQVDGLGMGCTLIENQLFRDMHAHWGDQKWFRSEEGGEDVWFFRRLKAMGVPVWLDPTVECGHIAESIITKEHWKQHHG